MRPDTDFHNHIVRSSARQMVQQAREKDLRVLGLSEHVFQLYEGRPPLEHMPMEGPMLSLADYFAQVRNAAEELHFDVRTGLEVDFVPEKNAAIQAVLADQPWDFLIGSVHQIDGQQIEVHLKLTREEGEIRWQHYFELLRAAAASGYFSVISHPVRMRVANPYLPPRLDEELERLAATATAHNVALEINGYDVLTYPSLVQRLMRACAAQHTPISVGSDAHDPRGVAQGHALSLEILQAVGIEHVRIWKAMEVEEYRF